MKVKKFEEIKCWQEARKLVKIVYNTINSHPKMASDYQFASQISAAAMDLGYINENEKNEIYDQAEKVCKLNSGMIKYLMNK